MTTGPESPVRDAALDAAWRANSLDEPPAQVDAAILAAAHRAVAAGSRDVRRVAGKAASPDRWWMPLAAAAMIGAVVIGVSRMAPQDQAPTAPFVSDIPARDAAPRDNAIPLEGKDASARVPELGAATKRIAEAPAAGVAAPPARAPSVAFTPSPAERGPTTALGGVAPSEDAASESTRADQPSAPASTFAPAPPSLPRAGASPPLTGKIAASSSATDARTPDADAWIVRIRKLYDEGKLTEAAKELDALRAAVPDADRRLPPEVRAWARTIEPRP